MVKWVIIGLLSWIGLAVLLCIVWVLIKELEGRR